MLIIFYKKIKNKNYFITKKPKNQKPCVIGEAKAKFFKTIVN